MFVVSDNESQNTILDLSNASLLLLLRTRIPLVIMCVMKVRAWVGFDVQILSTRLEQGAPPARDFVYLPMKTDCIECRSGNRRSTWTPYRVILDRERLLLYRVEALKEMTPKTTRLLCSKVISLDEVDVEQTPDEARTNGLRLNSPFEKETYRLFRFFNDNEYSEWNRVSRASKLSSSVFLRSSVIAFPSSLRTTSSTSTTSGIWLETKSMITQFLRRYSRTSPNCGGIPTR